jgi:hypothetical protein
MRENQHSVYHQRIVAQWFGEEDVAPKGEAADHARAAGEALAAKFRLRVRRWAAGMLMRGGEAEAEVQAQAQQEAEESEGELTEKLQVSAVVRAEDQSTTCLKLVCTLRIPLARPA